MNKVLLLGSKGQLGTSFSKILKQEKYDFIEFDLPEFDLLNKRQTEKIISKYKPDILINCIAYNDVTKAEIEIDKAIAINGSSLKYLAEFCNANNTLLCHFSTDYVFDGQARIPYIESEAKNPVNTYGLSKSNGEDHILNTCKNYVILRTAALFGRNSYSTNSNIIEKFIQLGKTHSTISVVEDEITSPTFSDNLAEQTLKIIENNLSGIFHATSEGFCNWYELAEYIFWKLKIKCELKKVSSKAFNKNLIKPAYSVLENKRLKTESINIMYHWKNAVDRYLEIRE
jgi:dTDP-4-dehydrorhamnose reductase